MSDPLSVTVSIVALLQLAATATQYLKDAKHGPVDRMRLRDEVRTTTCLLEILRDRVEDEAASSTAEESRKPSLVATLGGLDGPLNLFKDILEDVVAQLVPQDRLRRLSKPFTWPFDKKDIVEMLAALERLKSTFNLILQNDLIELNKLSGLKLDHIDQNLEDSRAKAETQERQDIINWISSLSFRARHSSVLESVQTGTGLWLLRDVAFTDWINGNIDTLWCPGIPGAGKTRLVSLVIDHIEQNPLPNTACAFVYCDYNLRDEQTPVALLSCILQQIIQSTNSPDEHLPPELSSLYELHKKYNTRPTFAQITDILRKLITNLTSLYVVIDALDECGESEPTALQFVSAVQALGPQTKVLCTSRFSTTFTAHFAGTRKLEISAQHSDIALFLDTQIQQQHRLSRHVKTEPLLKQEIIATIIEESKGMFLLAKLHIESLSLKISRKEVRSSLRTLPTTLDATYENALQRIHLQSAETAKIAESILFWVVCAKRILTVRELQHIYATQELGEDERLEEDDLPDGDILTGLCAGLILIDGESQSVRLVHYTAQQYFERSRSQELVSTRLELSNLSLKYLTLPNFSDGVCKTDLAMMQCLDKYVFLDYAARYWGSDVAKACIDDVPHCRQFALSAAAINLTCQVSSVTRAHYNNWSQEYPRNVPLLVIVASFDLPRIVRQLVEDGHDIEGHGSDGETPLIRAASLGHNDTVKVLLELGAALNAQDHMQETSLHRAARAGMEGLVQLLINGNVNVNAKASSDWTPLMAAVESGNLKIVKMLINAGADIAAETEWGDSALSIATRNEQETIATALADSGAVLPRNQAGRRASIVASRRGLARLVRRLTADYEALAGKPLERQSSRLMGGLEEILEGEEPHDDTQAAQQRTSEDSSSADFSEYLESFQQTTGLMNRYKIEDRIGLGHFAEVYCCSNMVTNVRYAVKIFTMDSSRASQQSKAEGLQQEIYILEEIDRFAHPNIIHLAEVFAEPNLGKIYMVQELAEGGELFNFIVNKVKLTEDETRVLFSQLFSAVEFLHNHGIAHRDIKPENILLTDATSLTPKLCDFGLAKKIGTDPGDIALTSTLCGTPSYVAPEVLAPSARRKYGLSVDIWSCGVVLYICLCGFPPFSDELFSEQNPYTLSQQIRMGRFDYPSPHWDSVGDPALDLIDAMLTVDTEKRLTIRQCLDHPWMLDIPAILSASSDPILASVVRSESPAPI